VLLTENSCIQDCGHGRIADFLDVD